MAQEVLDLVEHLPDLGLGLKVGRDVRVGVGGETGILRLLHHDLVFDDRLQHQPLPFGVLLLDLTRVLGRLFNLLMQLFQGALEVGQRDDVAVHSGHDLIQDDRIAIVRWRFLGLGFLGPHGGH